MRRGRALAIVLAAVLVSAGCADSDYRSYPIPSTTIVAATLPETTTTVAPTPAPAVEGLLTFRGNATRSFYGRGPVPAAPQIAWRYPDRAMCSTSVDIDGTREWCGTGWTGQPSVWRRDGRLMMAFGAFDRAVHLVDATTGADIVPPFPTGDIIKGSVSVDPDGFPLIYTGSRDNKLRILSFDTGRLVEVWSLDARAVRPTMWNDDWDGSPLILGNWMIEGGENSQLHVVELNRTYGADGKVAVAPRLVFNAPGWDDELLRSLPDRNVSIESSVAAIGDTMYFANSGGLVQGWDLSPLRSGGTPQRTFRFWMGDDVDATVVTDTDGYLYVAAERERGLPRADEVGQVVKLDPRRAGGAGEIVWRFADPPPKSAKRSGVWATPAVVGDIVIVATDTGRLAGLDRQTGTIRWEKRLPPPLWQSPVVVDDVLVQGDCNGTLHGYDLKDTKRDPPELWSVKLGGCIESTPAVWDGGIWVGTKGGHVFGLR